MPSELQLSCSVCQSKFWVDRPSSQSGGRFNCPTCGAVVDQGQPPVDATPSGHDTSHTKDAGGQRSDGRRAAVVTGVSPANSPASSPSAGSSILRPAQQNDEIGRLGPYRVLQVLGVGGMGIVYLAEDPKLKRQIALKAIQPRYAGDYDARHRFLREAQAQAQLEHEHIVSIYQADEDNGVPYIAMPLLRGQTLAHRLKESRTLPVETVLRIGRDIAEGLAAAHARGLMHRDIKPSNIWLEAQRDRAKILDFGLARAFAQGEQIQITQSGMVIGTPAYMSPEQARGEAVDARSDLFSLGVVLYSAITGELPFKGKDTFAILTALAVDNPTPPSTLNEGVSAALSDVLLKLLARKPDDRYQSASEVAAILDEFARTEATPVASRSSPPLSAGSTTAPLRTPAPTPAPLPPASLATMPLPPAPPQPAPPQPAPPQPAPLPEEPLSLSKQPGSEKAPAHLHFRGFGCMVQITVTCVVLIAVGGLGWYYLHSPWSGDWVIIAHKANSLAELETRLGQHLKSKDFLAAFQAAEAEKGLKPDERAKLQGMIVEPLLAELKQSKDTFGTLDQLKVSEIYQAKHLSNEQADAVRQMARAALAGKVNALLDDLKKKADRDLSAGEPLLQSAMALPKSFQDKYDPSLDLDAKTLDRIEFWHKLLEIDRRLYAGKPDPAKAFDLYLDLVKSRTAFEQSLDRQTELFLKHPEISKRFKEHKSVFLAKRDAMKLVSARPALDANLAEPLIDNVDAIFAKAKSRVQSPEFDWRQRESWGPISKLAEQAVEYGPQNPKAHWLKGWAKLQEARAVRYGDPKLGSPEIAREAVYETVKLATLAEAETTLTTAATLAEKVKATDPPLAALIYLELAEAFLDAADYYAQIPYDGIRKRLQADERKKDCLQKANEWVRIAQLSAKPGQQPVANEVMADIHESLGKRLYHLAFYAHLDEAEGFTEALKEFERALALDPRRLGPAIGKGRILYREARLHRDNPKLAPEKDAQAEKAFEAARAAFGDSLLAVEPAYYLGAIAYYRKDRKKELAYYDEALNLYEQHKNAAGYTGPIHAAALQFAELAALAAAPAAQAAMQNPNLTPQKTYALKMEALDPARAAEMYRRYGILSVAVLHGRLAKLDPNQQKAERLKQRKLIVEALDQLLPAGAKQGAVDSELLLVKWRLYEAMVYWDDQKSDIYVNDDMVRNKLLAQFERNAELAPNDYIRAWSLLFMAEIDMYSENKTRALDRYKKGLALAEQLAKLHGGVGSIAADRPFEKGKNSTHYDDWGELFRYYQGAAQLAVVLSRDPAAEAERRNYLSYALDCVNKALSGDAGAPAEARPQLQRLKKEIEGKLAQ